MRLWLQIAFVVFSSCEQTTAVLPCPKSSPANWTWSEVEKCTRCEGTTGVVGLGVA